MKLDYLISQIRESISSTNRTLPILLFILSFAFGLLAAIFTTSRVSKERPSYVALTKQSEEDRDKGIKAYEKEFMPAVWAAAGAILVAVVGRVVGVFIIKRYFE